MHSDLFDRIDRTVTEHNMLCPEDRVVAAVSGGADSMLLLHYLLSRRERWPLKITVAHVEHGIRGESSRADAAFVRDFCARQHLSYFEKQSTHPERPRPPVWALRRMPGKCGTPFSVAGL